MLTDKTWIIGIEKQITFDSLWHVNEKYQKQEYHQTESLGTSQETYAGWEKVFPKLIRKGLL